MISARKIWKFFVVIISFCIVGLISMLFMNARLPTASNAVFKEQHFGNVYEDIVNERNRPDTHDTEFIKIKRSGSVNLDTPMNSPKWHIKTGFNKTGSKPNIAAKTGIRPQPQANISLSRNKQNSMLERPHQAVDSQHDTLHRPHQQDRSKQDSPAPPHGFEPFTPRLQEDTSNVIVPNKTKPILYQDNNQGHQDKPRVLKSNLTGNETFSQYPNSHFNKSHKISLVHKMPAFTHNATCENGNNVTINPFERGPKPYGSQYRSKNKSEHIPNDCTQIWYSSTSLPVTALASAPGSGNTWARHLIQQLTGIFTGAVYYDKELFDAGFLGEYMISSQLVAIKTHEHWDCSPMLKLDEPPKMPALCPQYQKAILIIRDPYEAAVAEFQRLMASGQRHTEVLDKLYYYTDYWQMHVQEFLPRWRKTILAWLNFPNRDCLHVTSYKQLKTRLKDELISLGRFLHVDEKYLTGAHLNCVLNNKNGLFKRPHHVVPSVAFTNETDGLMMQCRRDIEMKLKMVGKEVTF